MAESKKRKALFNFKINKRKAKKYDVVDFNGKNSERKRRKLGKRFTVIRNRIILIASVVALLAISSYFIMSILHPVGVFEYLGHNLKISGNGEGYDIDVSGGSPINIVDENKIYFAVTDRSVNCYNTKGKILFENQHLFKQPVLKTAETRYVLYGQGETELHIGNVSGTLHTVSFEHGIICAYISDSGHYAVATKTEGYESSVAVFDKNNKKVYEWFLSDEIVNGVCLTPNGKTLAVSTIKAEKGSSVSAFYVLKYDQASPVMSKNYSDEFVYGLKSTSNTTFCAVFSNRLEFINYKKQSVSSHESEYSVSMVKQVGNRLIAVRTVAANHDDSLIEIYNKKGELISSFKADSYVSDVSYKSGKIYLLGISKAYKYDIRGKLIASSDVGYDTTFIEVIADNKLACVRNSTIEKHELKKIGE